MVPNGAVLEATLIGRVRVYDVSGVLPKGHGRSSKRNTEIDTQFVHHSGRDGRQGYAGLLASTRYVINHRKFNGCAYHFWIPRQECDDNGYFVVYRCNVDAFKSWHSGGKANHRGLGIALQGNTTQRALTDSQKRCLRSLLGYNGARLNLTRGDVLMHNEGSKRGGRNKKACPGKSATEFVTKWRKECVI